MHELINQSEATDHRRLHTIAGTPEAAYRPVRFAPVAVMNVTGLVVAVTAAIDQWQGVTPSFPPAYLIPGNLGQLPFARRQGTME